MSGSLFAFRVAKPVEPFEGGEAAEVTYDPKSQTAVWKGGTGALAKYCTTLFLDVGYRNCYNPSGPSGCRGSGAFDGGFIRYRCDYGA